MTQTPFTVSKRNSVINRLYPVVSHNARLATVRAGLNHKHEVQLSPRYVSRLTRDTLALILAGGHGSRLGPLTD
jgi:hypothetical protein